MRLRQHPARLSTPVGLALVVVLVAALQVLIAPGGRPATPAAGSIGPSPAPATLTWTGPNKSAIQSDQLTGHNTKAESDAICTEEQAFCDDFTLTVASDATYWAAHDGALEVGISWTNPANDFDLYIFDSSGVRVAVSGDPGNLNAENVSIDQPVGTYLVRASYYSVLSEGYKGTATFRSEAATPPTPLPPAGLPRFANYPAPAGVGDNAGEPTLGVNHKTGKVMYIAGTETLQVTFDECSSPASASWVDKTPPTQSGTTLDPILFTDSEAAPTDTPNRCFNSQLLGKASDLHYSDDDGQTWTRSQGTGLNSGVDHQSIGGGPYRPNSGLPLPQQAYPRAIYYCSQDVADASCARSDTGGLTFGPAVPMYTLAECLGLHGHVKVAPDGTVYVPNRACAREVTDGPPIFYGGGQTVVVSEDNGVTWDVREPTAPSSAGDSDPSVAIAKDGTAYLGYVNGDGIPRVAVSTDKAKSWARDGDVGAQLGIKNAVFPAAVAGDGDRAAVAFLGTTTGGDYEDQANFKGVWHLYLATTFDRGVSWHTTNLTPNDPVQRGSICTSGTGCDNTPNDRNLLDFMDATLDAEGRVLVAYADGCVLGCVAGGRNSFTAKATIARQHLGLRMVAAFDEEGRTGPPAAPAVTLARDNSVTARLSWPVPEAGGSPILGYRVYRSTQKDTGYTLLAETSLTKYVDRSGDPGVDYWYRVTAFNSQGEGQNCREVGTVGVPFSETPCTGNGLTVLHDPSNDSLTGKKQHDVQRIAIGEPFQADGVEKVVFTLKVAGFDGEQPTPGTTWPIQFTRTAGANQQGYRVQMQTTATGAVSYTYRTVAFDPTSVDGYGAGGPAMPADAGTFGQDGTIRITVTTSKLSAGPGHTFENFNSRIQTGVIVPDNAPDSAWPGGTPYVLVGNNFCRPNSAPLADLKAFPMSGPAPLPVDFDARGSTDPDGDAIASYTFDFGDGSPPVTQPTGTIRHTYRAVGEFRARVRVNDARGLLSSNVAATVIEVTPRTAETADLSVKKVADKPETPSGDIVTWTVTVTNLGPAAATGVAINDFLPDGVQVESAETPSGTCVQTGNRLRCPVGGLAKDAAASAVIRARVSQAGPLTNTASSTGDQTDLDDTNSSDAVTTNVTSAASPPPANDPPAGGSGQTTSQPGSGSTPAASGSAAPSPTPTPKPKPRAGYTLVAADGGIFNFGTTFHGSTGAIVLDRPIVGMANQPDDRGYRFVASDGGVFSFGDAGFHGSVRSALGGGFPTTPVTSMAVTPSGEGYWVVTRGGQVFAFGDAPTIGSFPANRTTGGIVAIVGTASGRGYWLVTEHGGVERFGDAPDVGSVQQALGGQRPRLPIVAAGISAGGRGLILAAGDGGVFALGDAPFEGSLPEVLGGRLPNEPITGLSATPTGRGYWLGAADGGVFSFGDAAFLGSMGGVPLTLPVVGMSSLR